MVPALLPNPIGSESKLFCVKYLSSGCAQNSNTFFVRCYYVFSAEILSGLDLCKVLHGIPVCCYPNTRFCSQSNILNAYLFLRIKTFEILVESALGTELDVRITCAV